MVIIKLRFLFFPQRAPIISNIRFVPWGSLLRFKGKKWVFSGGQQAVCVWLPKEWLGVAGLKTNLRERIYPPGDKISILSHSEFSVIEEVQAL